MSSAAARRSTEANGPSLPPESGQLPDQCGYARNTVRERIAGSLHTAGAVGVLRPESGRDLSSALEGGRESLRSHARQAHGRELPPAARGFVLTRRRDRQLLDANPRLRGTELPPHRSPLSKITKRMTGSGATDGVGVCGTLAHRFTKCENHWGIRADLAQWQSSCFVNRGFRVRAPGSAQ